MKTECWKLTDLSGGTECFGYRKQTSFPPQTLGLCSQAPGYLHSGTPTAGRMLPEISNCYPT